MCRSAPDLKNHPKLCDAAPAFVAKDVARTAEYYRDVLGFNIEFLHGSLYEKLKAKGANILKPPQDYDYGMRDFDLDDLDGNHLGFGMESKR